MYGHVTAAHVQRYMQRHPLVALKTSLFPSTFVKREERRREKSRINIVAGKEIGGYPVQLSGALRKWSNTEICQLSSTSSSNRKNAVQGNITNVEGIEHTVARYRLQFLNINRDFIIGFGFWLISVL